MPEYTRRSIGKLALIGLIPLSGCLGDDDETEPAEAIVAEWWNDQSTEMDNAFSHLEDGDSAYDDEDYETALTEYEAAFESFRSIASEAGERSQEADPEEEQLLVQIWLLVVDYFFAHVEVASSRFNAAYEIAVNEDLDAADDFFEESNQQLDTAAEYGNQIEDLIGEYDDPVIHTVN